MNTRSGGVHDPRGFDHYARIYGRDGDHGSVKYSRWNSYGPIPKSKPSYITEREWSQLRNRGAKSYTPILKRERSYDRVHCDDRFEDNKWSRNAGRGRDMRCTHADWEALANIAAKVDKVAQRFLVLFQKEKLIEEIKPILHVPHRPEGDSSNLKEQEVEVTLSDGSIVGAAVPSGAKEVTNLKPTLNSLSPYDFLGKEDGDKEDKISPEMVGVISLPNAILVKSFLDDEHKNKGCVLPELPQQHADKRRPEKEEEAEVTVLDYYDARAAILRSFRCDFSVINFAYSMDLKTNFLGKHITFIFDPGGGHLMISGP